MSTSTASVSSACACASRRLAHTSRELAGFQYHSVLNRPTTPTTASTSPLTTLAAELQSLQDVLSQTTDAIAAAAFPQDLAIYLPTIIAACSPIVDDLRDVLSAEPSVSAASVARNCAEHIEPVLQVCRLALGLALDLMAALRANASSATDATSEFACVLAGAAHLRTRVRTEWHDRSDDGLKTNAQEPDSRTATSTGQRAILAYLKILREHAHAALVHGDNRPVSPTTTMRRMSLVSSICDRETPSECTPDSAVDLDDSFAEDLLAFPLPPRSPVQRASRAALPALVAPPTARSSPPLLPARSMRRSIAASSEISATTTETAVNTGLVPSRPPTPPPKAASRASTALARRSVVRTSLESSVADTLLATEATANMASAPKTATTTASAVKASTLPAASAAVSFPAPSQATTRPSILGMFRSRTRAGRHARMASAAAMASGVSALAANSGGSHRFSLSLPSVRLLADSSTDPCNNGNSSEPGDAVFGVPLRKSLAVASTAARTHHGGPASMASAKKSSSVRAFPLCVFACYSFLGASGTGRLGTPGLFDAARADRARVARLRVIFSTPPSYGADVFAGEHASSSPDSAPTSGYTPHDAAALILEFLAVLPRPLVSEAVARRWVALSRQAAAEAEAESERTNNHGLGHGTSRWTTTSHATRVDQCLDFWDEALGGGGLGRDSAIARSLLKLLLNLWGDVADAADSNGMSAERLAGKVLEPLMHLDHGSGGSGSGGARHASVSSSSSSSASAYTRTDYMLGLAFIIRKRSEYGQLLRGSGRKSKAAFAG